MNKENKISTLTAKLILSTNRKKRQFNLVEVANNIIELSDEVGGLNQVSKILGLKRDILNRILSVLKLEVTVKQMFEKQIIDGIFLAYYLSGFNSLDQIYLARNVANGNLNAKDIRAFAPLRKRNLVQPIGKLIDKYLKSKNIKIKVAYLDLRRSSNNSDKIIKRIQRLIHKDNLVSFEIKDNIGILKVKEKGWKQISLDSKKNGMSTRSYLNSTIERL